MDKIPPKVKVYGGKRYTRQSEYPVSANAVKLFKRNYGDKLYTHTEQFGKIGSRNVYFMYARVKPGFKSNEVNRYMLIVSKEKKTRVK